MGEPVGPVRKIELERDGERILLTLRCADEYAAIVLTDDIAANLRDGFLSLEIESTGPVTKHKREVRND